MTTIDERAVDGGADPEGARYAGRIDHDAAAAFASATNDHNARYANGQSVPPLFTATLVLEAQFRVQRAAGGIDRVVGARGGVHGKHDIHFTGRPLRPGTALRWTATNHSLHQTKGGVLDTQHLAVTDVDGVLLVEHLWSSFYIGATLGAEVGPPLPDHTFPEAARAHPVGSRSVGIDRDQGFRYAGVSGDHAPHAMDDEVARAEGHPGKILQGMCTFGIASGVVVDLAADGDPDRLARLAVRFSAPTLPGKDLEVRLFDAGRNAQGGRCFAFEALQDGVAVLKHGWAELLPD